MVMNIYDSLHGTNSWTFEWNKNNYEIRKLSAVCHVPRGRALHPLRLPWPRHAVHRRSGRETLNETLKDSNIIKHHRWHRFNGLYRNINQQKSKLKSLQWWIQKPYKPQLWVAGSDEPRCCKADFPCESKLSQIKSTSHHQPCGSAPRTGKKHRSAMLH